jgi:DNA-binding transcriptional MocR family regulator
MADWRLTRLPGERELASALDVSRTTISSALAHLREEGYLESRHGSGSRVILPDTAPYHPFSGKRRTGSLHCRPQCRAGNPPGLYPRYRPLRSISR